MRHKTELCSEYHNRMNQRTMPIHTRLTPFDRKIIYILLGFLITKVSCQLGVNTPPVMRLDRNWRIPSNEAIGSIITKVLASDPDHDPLLFGLETRDRGLENHEKTLPFRIDNQTGVVYLNESLYDKEGQDIILYVTVTDGKLTAKNEVWVHIFNPKDKDNLPLNSYDRSSTRQQPSFLPNFNQPSGISLYRPPSFPLYPINPNLPPLPPEDKNKRTQTKTYIEKNNTISNDVNKDSKITQLLPSSPIRPVLDDKYNEVPTGDNYRNVSNVTESSARPIQDLTITIVPVAMVCIVIIVTGILAVVFRKRLCPTRTSSKKANMAKDPNGGIVLQEAPPLALQGWRGPRAFSNRYESNGENTNHFQQTSIVGPDVKIPTDRWEFPRHRLKVFDILGEGAFGQVWRCEATDIDGKIGPTIVAVKTLKENANEKERSDLLSELQVMKNLEPHPNVVRLLACCTEKDPIFVIMEYISLGKLQAFLRASRAEKHYGNVQAGSETLTSRDLTSFVYQVAKGMEFLSSKGIIHRDLAARNILITQDHICKVADFGFARDVVTSLVYERKSEGRLPIRWMAPESLYDNIFSVKSDVWSFGILIWEIVTLGSTPYPGLSAGEVMRKVRDGHRLEKPEHCRRELYNIMFYCWDKDPAERPTFSECVKLLERLLMTETDYIELERFPDHSYYNVVNLSDEKL